MGKYLLCLSVFSVSKIDDIVQRKCICTYINFGQSTEVSVPECRHSLMNQSIFGEWSCLKSYHIDQQNQFPRQILSPQSTQARSDKNQGKNRKHNCEDDSILLARRKVREQRKVLRTTGICETC